MPTTIVRTRVDRRTAAAARRVLSSLGLTPSTAVNALFAQIASRKALPFVLSTPDAEYAASEYGMMPRDVVAVGRRLRRATARARRSGKLREIRGPDDLGV